MIDYKQLLIRYIEHIKCINGTSFINTPRRKRDDIILGGEDINELNSLSSKYIDPDEAYQKVIEAHNDYINSKTFGTDTIYGL